MKKLWCVRSVIRGVNKELFETVYVLTATYVTENSGMRYEKRYKLDVMEMKCPLVYAE